MFDYPAIVQIHFFTYPWVVNGIMHGTNESYTYPCIVNSTIHVQFDEFV